MTHRNDFQNRTVTKHPGSKQQAPATPVKGQRVALRASPEVTGVIARASKANGAFAVTYDEGTALAGRTFWYQSYQVSRFVQASGGAEDE